MSGTMRFTLTVGGLERIATRFEQRANFLRSERMRALLVKQGDTLLKAFRKTIDSFMPGQAQDLKDATKKAKQRLYGRVYPILKATGELYDQMAMRVVLVTGRGWVMRIYWKGSRRSASENVKIAKIHIEGKGHMPQRDFTEVPHNFASKVFDAISDGLRRST